ncbi:MAG: oxygenase MpaB family protein, partial [Actinomycetes bacterium]
MPWSPTLPMLPLGSPRAAVRRLLTGHPGGAAPWVTAIGEPGDDGWFGPGSTIWAVHADAATLVGGVRALLVQAMHPTVLAGFDQHSAYRDDPESRLQRTAAFVTVTTFGTSEQAERACERVRRAHAPVRGTTPTGEAYDAADPELLGWVHLALVDSLAESVRRYGSTRFDLDEYLAETARVGEHLGAANVPRHRAGLAAAYDHYRPQLARTAATSAAHVFLLDPPLPPHLRVPYRVVAAAAVAT